jgi:hypothetical protein
VERFECASKEWVDQIRVYLERELSELGPDAVGAEFRICEVYTNAPAHLTQGDEDFVAWWIEINGSDVEVGFGIPEWAATEKIEIDYDVVLPIVRTVYSENPEAAAAARARAEDRRKAQGTTEPSAFERLPKKVQAAIAGIHDHLARRTL